MTGIGVAQGHPSAGVTDHGVLTGLSDDDHLQYLLITGIRAMTGDLDMGTFNIGNVGLVDGVDVSTHDHSGAGQGGTVDHTDLSSIGTNSHAAIDTHIADATIHFTEGSIDHGNIAGLGDDDHVQYILLAGRAGGQAAFGGTAAGEELILRGTTNANLGQIRFRSPIDFDDVTAANALNPYSIRDASTSALTAAFIGGTFADQRTVTFTNAVTVYEVLRGAPNIQSLTSPAFAAFTLFQALPILRAGSTAGFNPLNPLVLNAGPVMQNEFTGTKTCATAAAINWAGQLRATVSGAVMNVTDWTGLINNPSFSTVAGSTINFGTIRAVHCQEPSVGLFQPSAGTEAMTAYYGLEYDAMAFGGNVAKEVVRSSLAAATNAYFLRNLGGAQSDFGSGVAHWNDNTWAEFGGSLTTADILYGWFNAHEAMVWSTALGLATNPLFLAPGATNEWVFRHNLAGTQDIGIGFNVNAIVFGTTAPTPNSNNWFVQFSAPNQRQPQIGGEYADVLWTAGGSIDINGLGISNLDAFKINAVAYILNGGTVADVSTLHVAAMSSDGIATRSHALRVQGRTRIDGHMNHNESTALAQLTANVTQLVLPANNGMRHVYLLDADGAGPWTVRGVLNVQTGDSFYIVNDGANAFLLGHQDGTAAAADRIISPTGANLTLGPNEMAKLWYDSTVSRWRILEHTGA